MTNAQIFLQENGTLQTSYTKNQLLDHSYALLQGNERDDALDALVGLIF